MRILPYENPVVAKRPRDARRRVVRRRLLKWGPPIAGVLALLGVVVVFGWPSSWRPPPPADRRIIATITYKDGVVERYEIRERITITIDRQPAVFDPVTMPKDFKFTLDLSDHKDPIFKGLIGRHHGVASSVTITRAP